MEINLNWDHFKSPTVDVIKGYESKYPELKKAKLDEIKTRSEIQENSDIHKAIEFTMEKGKDIKLRSELGNQILTASFNLKHLWFYQSLNPRRFNGSESTAASIYYQTYYEVVYSKLSSSFDYFLQLVNLYYELGLLPNEVTKGKVRVKISKLYQNIALDNTFRDLEKNKNLENLSNIRNSFIHRKSVFDEYFVFEDGNIIDKFDYTKKAIDAITHFTNHINFLNNEAIPFLYKFKDYKKVI